MKIVSVETMQSLDRRTIEAGTPGGLLMQRAGRGAFDWIQWFIRRLHPRHRQAISVFAGKGNNGGDAYVVAGLLAMETDIATTVYTPCPINALSCDALFYARQLPDRVRVVVCGDTIPESAFADGALLVDGLLGTGITGPLRPPYGTYIEQINASGRPIVSIDVPSGLDADAGTIATAAVQADLTVTMALPKKGLLSEQGIRLCGMLKCVDIGTPCDLIAEARSIGLAIFEQDVSKYLVRRPVDAHKGTFGRVLVIGGAMEFVGAPLLTGHAALRSGCGLATIAAPAAAARLMSHRPNALIVKPMPDDDAGFFSNAAAQDLEDARAHADIVALGPGFGLHDASISIVEQVLSWDLPVVVDADGLKLLARVPACLPRTAPTVLTPHPGEMRTLLDGFGLSALNSACRVEQACKLAAKTGCHVILKGLGTVVADPDGPWSINCSGTNALASGGAGDVLTGLVAGLMAQHTMDCNRACRAGVFIHGRAAEIAPVNARALIADDLLGQIGNVFRELTAFS